MFPTACPKIINAIKNQALYFRHMAQAQALYSDFGPKAEKGW